MSSPEMNTTGTPKRPAIAALMPASGIAVPFSDTDARFALEIVWARTPAGFVVAA